MNLFDYFKHEKKIADSSDNISAEKAVPCYKCGRLISEHFKFCPYCGEKRFDVYDYMKAKGLEHCADQYFNILIQINNEEILRIRLLGKQNDSDALQMLKDAGYLKKSNRNRFVDWPSANLPVYKAACVCELDENHIYHVISQTIPDSPMATLYGCPISKSITGSEILDHAEIQVVDYEK